MRRRSLTLLGVALLLGTSPVAAQAYPRVVIRTEVGPIEVEIDSIHAPVTAANFSATWISDSIASPGSTAPCGPITSPTAR